VGGANKEEPYPYHHLGYRRVGKEESRVFDSRTHELQVAKSACAKAQLSSHGNVRLMPGVKLHKAGVHKRPVDLLKVPAGNQRSHFSSRRIRTILCGSWPEEGGLCQSVQRILSRWT
jgi:hypothetical protein